VPKSINIPADPHRVALDEIKVRQRTRKESGIPKTVTLEILYQAQMDILENQARIENRQLEILKLLMEGR